MIPRRVAATPGKHDGAPMIGYAPPREPGVPGLQRPAYKRRRSEHYILPQCEGYGNSGVRLHGRVPGGGVLRHTAVYSDVSVLGGA